MSYRFGSADRSHTDEVIAQDPWDEPVGSSHYEEQYQSAAPMQAPPDFVAAIQSALAENGVDFNRLSVSQVYQLAQQAWQDTRLQQDYQGWAGSGAFAVSDSQFLKDVAEQFFSPTNSTSPGLLNFGISLLNQQGVPLSDAQQKYQQTGSATGPKPKFPGDDPGLDDLYPGVVSLWQKYFASPPTGQQIASLVGIPYQQGQQYNSASSSSGQQVAAGNYSLVQLAEQAGFSPAQAQIVAGIAMAESGGSPGAIGPAFGGDGGSIGLMQIQPLYHADLMQKYGGRQGLMDPLKNMQAAYDVFVQAGGSFQPWTTYNTGAYEQFMGSNPSVSTQGGSTVGASYGPPKQIDLRQIEDAIRDMPSHIAGIKEGQYYDMRNELDKISQSYFGHDSTDGIVKEMFDKGITNVEWMDEWYKFQSESTLGSYHYQSIVQANQPYTQSIYNESGFDPRWATQQYTPQQYVPQQQQQQPENTTPQVHGGGMFTE